MTEITGNSAQSGHVSQRKPWTTPAVIASELSDAEQNNSAGPDGTSTNGLPYGIS